MSDTLEQRSDPASSTPGAVAGLGAGEISGRRASLGSDAWRELRRNPVFLLSMTVIVLMVTIAAVPSLFTNADPRACTLDRSQQGPSAQHWFGFDVQGCDYYANVIYGARPSIVIGISVSVVSALVAVLLGSLSGYYGGIVDAVISRVTDVFFGMPFVLGALVMLSVFAERSVGLVAGVLVVLGWMTMTRLMRSSVLAAREMDYVNAARALGASDLRIMRRHILPNAVTPVMVYATVTVGIIISLEATLSFLGVGLQLPEISWGLQIQVAQNYFLESPHLLLFPAVFLSVTVLSFIMLGDAVRDAFDPKLR
ncbi:MAG: ABC transporter permease [Actinomycetes bacterium]